MCTSKVNPLYIKSLCDDALKTYINISTCGSMMQTESSALREKPININLKKGRSPRELCKDFSNASLRIYFDNREQDTLSKMTELTVCSAFCGSNSTLPLCEFILWMIDAESHLYDRKMTENTENENQNFVPIAGGEKTVPAAHEETVNADSVADKLDNSNDLLKRPIEDTEAAELSDKLDNSNDLLKRPIEDTEAAELSAQKGQQDDKRQQAETGQQAETEQKTQNTTKSKEMLDVTTSLQLVNDGKLINLDDETDHSDSQNSDQNKHEGTSTVVTVKEPTISDSHTTSNGIKVAQHNVPSTNRLKPKISGVVPVSINADDTSVTQEEVGSYTADGAVSNSSPDKPDASSKENSPSSHSSTSNDQDSVHKQTVILKGSTPPKDGATIDTKSPLDLKSEVSDSGKAKESNVEDEPEDLPIPDDRNDDDNSIGQPSVQQPNDKNLDNKEKPTTEEQSKGKKAGEEDGVERLPEASKTSDHNIEDEIPQQPRSQSGLKEPEEGHFFYYLLSLMVVCIVGYLVFHNKQKIIALIIEGRHERRRRPQSGSYKRLDTKEGGKSGALPIF